MDDDRDRDDEPEFDLARANEETVARLRAVVDISVMNMREHARLVTAYWANLLDLGLQPNVALSLTLSFQTVYFQSLLGG